MDTTVKPTIMVVDDDEDLLSLMVVMLQGLGYRTHTRATPPNWVDLAAVDPAMIFLDVDLARFNGVNICRSIKENLLNRHMPVVLISGHPKEQLEKEARACHADDHLVKPFAREAVKRLIDRYISEGPRRD
jgi:CheY-like chemotaxis protein